MDIRRVNLSFNLENREDKEIYEIINKQRFKTNFVCKAVVKYINSIDRENEVITKKELKNTLREVFKELDITQVDKINEGNIEENELPQEIFDMFSQL